MGCENSGTCCEIVDITFCLLNLIVENYCCDCCDWEWEKLTFFKFLPRFLIGSGLDLLAIIIMVFNTCAYHDGEDYIEGDRDFTISVDFANLTYLYKDALSYCDVTRQDESLQNATEVTHHELFVTFAGMWCFCTIMYIGLWVMFYAFIGMVALILLVCGKFDLSMFYLNASTYKLAVGTMKGVNFFATIIVIAKGILLMVYVSPSSLEWFIFVMSSIDCLLCIWEVFSFVNLCCRAKTVEQIEERENSCCLREVFLSLLAGCKKTNRIEHSYVIWSD